MVLPLSYSLNSNPRINWTENQEKSLGNDYIFDKEPISDDQFVVRTYLQFLWLPESIMPLKLLVPSLLRVDSVPTEPHALHAHLKPLLQTARSASRKYSVELPQILSNGGGAGEIEETMMWYALSYEKVDDELWTRTASISEGPWEDEQWRLKWLDRMEKREFQIQILLYFLKLSLPGPQPLASPEKKKRKRSQAEIDSEPTPAERLEIFLDKLSMWQLMEGLEKAKQPPERTKKDTLDWMQTFFEDVVKPQFEHQLPEICALMRNKIFSQPPPLSSSNPSSPSTSRASSPERTGEPIKRRPSPAPSISSSKARVSLRDRSRSLSVSLAQERIQRERSITIAGPKKRVLNREVSMSRAFKPKPRPTQEEIARSTIGGKKAGETNEPQGKQAKDEGVLLVEATPTKPKPKPVRSRPVLSFGGNADGAKSRVRSFSIQSSTHVVADEGDDDDNDEWNLPGSASPDVLLLGLGRRVGGAEVAGSLASPTPAKRSRIL